MRRGHGGVGPLGSSEGAWEAAAASCDLVLGGVVSAGVSIEPGAGRGC